MKKSIKDNKTVILEAARELFYEKGYDGTTFSDIAEKVGITKALITYYFKTKLELAHEVKNIYTEDIQQYVKYILVEHMDIDDKTILDAVSLRALENLYAKDFRANRFYMETPLYENEKNTVPSYERWEHRYSRIKENEIELTAVGYRGAHHAIHINYYRGNFPCTYDEYVDYLVALRLRMLNFSEDEISEVLKKSAKITNELDLIIKPYFIYERNLEN